MSTHYDLWFVDSQRVHPGVPYAVLADWVQQGRAGPADRVREFGVDEWVELRTVQALAAYLPHIVDMPNDRTEALQPLDLGLTIRRRRHDEDDDVDMIPLIDISLVLLIFFMMTSTVAVAGAGIAVPTIEYATLTDARASLWVGVDYGPGGQPIYSVGDGEAGPKSGDDKLSLDQVVDRLRIKLRLRNVPTVVRVAGHHRLPIETVRRLTARLGELKPEGLAEIKAEVTEKSP